MAHFAANQDELLTDLLGELAQRVDTIDSGDKANNIARCKEVIEDCKKALRALRSETRGLPNADRPHYEAAMKRHRERLTHLETEVQRRKEQRSQQPTAVQSEGGFGGGREYEDPKQGVHDTFDRIGNHQNDALRTLDRINQTVTRTEEVGRDANQELLRQRELIQDIDDRLDELGDDVTRAKRELNAFVRRMATDKLIMCFLFLLVLGIVAVIIVHFVVGNDSSGDAIPPSPPPRMRAEPLQ